MRVISLLMDDTIWIALSAIYVYTTDGLMEKVVPFFGLLCYLYLCGTFFYYLFLFSYYFSTEERKQDNSIFTWIEFIVSGLLSTVSNAIL